jgi:hypothetical protein
MRRECVGSVDPASALQLEAAKKAALSCLLIGRTMVQYQIQKIFSSVKVAANYIVCCLHF